MVKIIPLRLATPALPSAANGLLTAPIHDLRQRPLRDLRISVTDRCNFRCPYCMPKAVFHQAYSYLPHTDLLSFEEITRIAHAALQLGVEKIRLTGGEPLLRKEIEKLIYALAQLRLPAQRPLDLALTTNGALLTHKAQALKMAGLKRLTVSLDALDDGIFKKMNDVDFPVQRVLDGLEAAQAVGFTNIKINMVVQRGINTEQILPMTRFCLERGYILRLIEFMDVGNSNQWQLAQVVPSAEILQLLSTEYTLTPLPANYASEVASRWAYRPIRNILHSAVQGEIGFIPSVTQAFCQTCTRARLSTDGKLYTCLFAIDGYDLKTTLRTTTNDHTLQQQIAAIWRNRTAAYSQQRMAKLSRHAPSPNKIEMSYIGG